MLYVLNVILFVEQNILMAICKPRHWNLGIGIETDVANAIRSSPIRLKDPKLCMDGDDLESGDPTHKIT